MTTEPEDLETVVRLEQGERDPQALRQFALEAAIRVRAPGDSLEAVMVAAYAFLGFLEDAE